jgi:hypothetical protein
VENPSAAREATGLGGTAATQSGALVTKKVRRCASFVRFLSTNKKWEFNGDFTSNDNST